MEMTGAIEQYGTAYDLRLEIESMRRALSVLGSSRFHVGTLCNKAWAEEEKDGQPDAAMVRAIHNIRSKQSKIAETVWGIQEMLDDCLVAIDVIEKGAKS